MADGLMRFGDGPWVTVHDIKITWATRPTNDSVDAMLLAMSDRIDQANDAARLRGIGVDPSRVIDGETVQAVRKEIES